MDYSIWKGMVWGLLLMLCWACSGPAPKPVNVLLVHEFNEELNGYDEFHEAVLNGFRKKGYEPVFRMLYLNLEDQERNWNEKNLQQVKDTMDQSQWEPDIVLVEGDRSIEVMYNQNDSLTQNLIGKIPHICGGIIYPNWEMLNRYPKVVIIQDPTDVTKNIDLVRQLTGMNYMMAELDAYREDSLLRVQMERELRRAPYIYNLDFHVKELDENIRVTTHADSVLLMVGSIIHPELNGPEGTGVEAGRKMFTHLQEQAWNYPQLVLKKDLYGESIAQKSGQPRFTTRRELMATGKYLAGYFASYATVGNDMAEAAVEFIEGKGALTATRTHTKQYFMDWKQMETLGMSYSKHKNQFVILNAPEQVVNPQQFYGKWIAGILVLLLLLMGATAVYARFNRKRLRGLEKALADERFFTNLALRGVKNHYISDKGQLFELLEQLSDSQAATREEILDSLEVDGTYRFRIQAAIESDKLQEWWQLRYAVAHTNKGELMVEGLLININETMAFEQEIRRTEVLEQESKEKEKFLWKIAHEIRTPLNAILGFSELLDNMYGNLTGEEQEQMKDAIRENQGVLEKIINDIVQYAHIVNQKQHYELKPVRVEQLVQNFYQHYKGWIEEKGVNFNLIKGRPTVTIQADEEKLNNALFQLLDNARKFSEDGEIQLGWQYMIEKDKVEIFVEDCGMGISKEKMPVLFSMFWKDNGFIPGTGIGLNIAKSNIEAMNGELLVSTEEGLGSRFILILPVIHA